MTGRRRTSLQRTCQWRLCISLATLATTGCTALYPPGMQGFPTQLSGLPSSYTETYERVHHLPSRTMTRLTADPGNIWPGAPAKVLTTLDLLKQGRAAAAPNRRLVHRGGFGMCLPATQQGGASPGVALGLCAPVAIPNRLGSSRARLFVRRPIRPAR